MSRIVAVYGGGDWTDASVNHLVLPEGAELDAMVAEYKRWYLEVYAPSTRADPEYPWRPVKSPVKYRSLTEWLKDHGAREPTDDELLHVEDF